jgi:2-polyprenyl-3-methyl-5-hydroxy-6-metoxy-1,4-benzoquinol methylase
MNNIKKHLKKIWNANAAYWDKRMGEGNTFHKSLIEPNQIKLLKIKRGDLILDVACGNGQFARKMTRLGARVIAIDFSSAFIKIARAKPYADKISYKVLDVTSANELRTLRNYRFDSIVCTMALMDIDDIDPLMSFVPTVLKAKGRFVFSILHPCFNSGESTLIHERNDIGGCINNKYYVKMNNYLITQTTKGVAMVGQPMPQYYFHRPLSNIFGSCFRNNLILDTLIEPSFKLKDKKSIFDNVYENIPPALICRFRLKH